ncbi:MAG: DUF2303 family protein [Proteobacteria bacterium]|nr:DUF2303 family protein [Pseudomonadota bacterium]
MPLENAPVRPITSNAPTEAAAIAEVVQKSTAPILIDHEDARLIIWPQSGRIESLEEHGNRPRRKRGQAVFYDIESFCRYVRAHATCGTIITGASEIDGGFKATFDWHLPAVAYEDAEIAAAAAVGGVTLSDAGWGEHYALLPLRPTKEWLAWSENNGAGRARGQFEFAQFIEDNADDIYAPQQTPGQPPWPNAADMLQVATTLSARNDTVFHSGVRLQNGQVQLSYTERIDTTAGADGKMLVPERFAIRVAPFRGAALYEVRARLRYRIASSKLAMWYELERPWRVTEHAFNDVKAGISKETGHAVLCGAVSQMNTLGVRPLAR